MNGQRSQEDNAAIEQIMSVLMSVEGTTKTEIKTLKSRKPMRGGGTGLVYYDDIAGLIRDVPSP